MESQRTNTKSLPVWIHSIATPRELARYIIDEFGMGLSREELDESIGVVMENIPGLELASTHEIRQLTQLIRRQYDDENRDQD